MNSPSDLVRAAMNATMRVAMSVRMITQTAILVLFARPRGGAFLAISIM
jgi:hypothetical protein